MREKPKSHSKMIKDGRWTVAINTGYGPSHMSGILRPRKRPTAGLRPFEKLAPTSGQTGGPLKILGQADRRCVLAVFFCNFLAQLTRDGEQHFLLTAAPRERNASRWIGRTQETKKWQI